RLRSLEQHGHLTVHDAITLTWMPADEQPVIGHYRHRSARAAGRGSLLGALIGTVVLAPVAGAAAGAAVGAVAARVRGTGIDEDLLEEVVEALRPGTSALVVLSS